MGNCAYLPRDKLEDLFFTVLIVNMCSEQKRETNLLLPRVAGKIHLYNSIADGYTIEGQTKQYKAHTHCMFF